MKRILRVFPRRTSATPDDDLVVIGDPLLWDIEADEVHISITFTWDILEGKRLCRAWSKRNKNVHLGGPAFAYVRREFTPGLYLRPGITITSRGCVRNCDHCFVPEREGPIRTIAINDGTEVLDNNLLACPREHVEAVMDMLSRQKSRIRFTGGIDARLVRPWWTKLLSGIRTEALFTAYDSTDQKSALKRAIPMLLESGLTRRELGCYVLVGYKQDTLTEADKRLRFVWGLGAMPFAIYYQPKTAKKKRIPPRSWGPFMKQWSRPAIIKSRMKHEKIMAQQKDSAPSENAAPREKLVESKAV